MSAPNLALQSQLRLAARHAERSDFLTFLGQAFKQTDATATFAPNWHLQAMAEHLNAVARGEIKRLMINLPPRYLKSICASVAWPAFLLGQNPGSRIICASYAHQLAIKHSQDCRAIMQSGWYRGLFPHTRLLPGENTSKKYLTSARGFRLATSVGGGLIGEGADTIIIDDPLHPAQAYSPAARAACIRWFEHSLLSRLNDKANGRVVLVMQRLHNHDLSGHLLEKGGWHALRLPTLSESRTVIRLGHWSHTREPGEALHAARESTETLNRIRAELGSHVFATQYQQAPLARESAILLPEWLQPFDMLPAHIRDGLAQGTLRPVQSWDTAVKSAAANDASVCLTALHHEGSHYLLDVRTLRTDYPSLRREVLALAVRWNPSHILMEDAALGQALLQDLKRDSTLPLIGIRPRLGKVERALAISPALEAGRISLPLHAPWRPDFEAELAAFPHGTHDDQVDTLTQYLNWWQSRARIRPPSMRRF